MIPFEQMQHHDAQRAFEPMVFFHAHVIDLLRDRDGVDFREPAGAQKLGLTHRPRIEVVAFRRRALLFPNHVPAHRLVS
jgi:hypothetical protein